MTLVGASAAVLGGVLRAFSSINSFELLEANGDDFLSERCRFRLVRVSAGVETAVAFEYCFIRSLAFTLLVAWTALVLFVFVVVLLLFKFD